VTDWSDWPPPIDTVSRTGNSIAGFPDILANLRATYSSKDISVDPHTLVNLTVKLEPRLPAPWPQMAIEGRINNLFDTEYETGGYLDEEPLWIVGAKRHFFVSLTAGL